MLRQPRNNSRTSSLSPRCAVTMLGTHAAASMGLGLSGIWISVLLMVATRAAGTNIAAAFVNDPWGIAARISGDKRHPEARWAAKLALS